MLNLMVMAIALSVLAALGAFLCLLLAVKLGKCIFAAIKRRKERKVVSDYGNQDNKD